MLPYCEDGLRFELDDNGAMTCIVANWLSPVSILRSIFHLCSKCLSAREGGLYEETTRTSGHKTTPTPFQQFEPGTLHPVSRSWLQQGVLEIGNDVIWAAIKGRTVPGQPPPLCKILRCDGLHGRRLQVGEQETPSTGDVSQSAARTPGPSHVGGASCVVDVSFSGSFIVTGLRWRRGWRARLPPRLTGLGIRWDHSRAFAWVCRYWSAGFLGDIPFPAPLRSGAAPYSRRFIFIGSQYPDNRWNVRVGETGDPLENLSTSGIVPHDCGFQKSDGDPAEPMRVVEVNIERRRNEGAGEAGDPRENRQTNVIVRHDSHLRKSGNPAGD
ncbi:hypothetical protein PR048_012253 [Dryococelus australis]|uniref:Uncharacterized protein n=1 Tax=Dryococelus australis TaxID=614101 RepID=A0ABQ9HNY9_9NEOP|nr:hypothetical protein PR048_012253 [Dryococelus australis]